MSITRFTGSYRFLSNFYPSPLVYLGRKYTSVEHAFQAMKTKEEPLRRAIAGAETPGIAKRMGRKVSLRDDWEKVKVDIMLDLLRLKFKNKDLGVRLLATQDEKLEEGNTWGDRFWGTVDGRGKNMLGILLMQVRDELRQNE